MAKEEKDFIQNAVKHPGAETASAEHAGKPLHEFEQEHEGDSGRSGKRARLGLLFAKMAAARKK